MSRARYHRAIRHLERYANKIRMDKMAQALLSARSRDMWGELRRMRGRNSRIVCSVDDNNDSCDIANMFSDKYSELYNSVPYNDIEMNSIEKEINSRLHAPSKSNVVITVCDVTEAIKHLKRGKSDGSEGLCSDHFIHGHTIYMCFYLFIYIVFNSWF